MAYVQLTKASVPSIAIATRGATVVIEVGPEKQKYNVHEALLTHHSEYFRRALEGSWKEAQEGKVILNDVDNKAFALFVHWLYTQDTPPDEEDWACLLGLEWDPSKDYSNDMFDTSIKAYVFGDRFIALGFRCAVNNYSVAVIKHIYFQDPTYQTLSYAFENTPANRAILQRLVEDYCHCWDAEYSEQDTSAEVQKDLPVSFLLRVSRRYKETASMGQGKENDDKKTARRCYNEHPTEEEQTACADRHMVYDAKQDYGYFP